MNGQHHALSSFTSGDTGLDTHSIEGQAGLRAHMATVLVSYKMSKFCHSHTAIFLFTSYRLTL